MILEFPLEKKNVKYFSNISYTGVFIRHRTVTKLRTLGQLRHRSVATIGIAFLLTRLYATSLIMLDNMPQCTCQNCFDSTGSKTIYLSTAYDLVILFNIMSLDIDIIYTNDIFWLQSSDTTFGALLYLA